MTYPSPINQADLDHEARGAERARSALEAFFARVPPGRSFRDAPIGLIASPARGSAMWSSPWECRRQGARGGAGNPLGAA